MKKGIILTIISVVISCIAISQSSFNMSLLHHWKDSTITGSTLYDNSFNEIWGYANNGREYAIIGSSRGTHFFDVTIPTNPVQVDFVMGRDTGYIAIRSGIGGGAESRSSSDGAFRRSGFYCSSCFIG